MEVTISLRYQLIGFYKDLFRLAQVHKCWELSVDYKHDSLVNHQYIEIQISFYLLQKAHLNNILSVLPARYDDDDDDT